MATDSLVTNHQFLHSWFLAHFTRLNRNDSIKIMCDKYDVAPKWQFLVILQQDANEYHLFHFNKI